MREKRAKRPTERGWPFAHCASAPTSVLLLYYTCFRQYCSVHTTGEKGKTGRSSLTLHSETGENWGCLNEEVEDGETKAVSWKMRFHQRLLNSCTVGVNTSVYIRKTRTEKIEKLTQARGTPDAHLLLLRKNTLLYPRGLFRAKEGGISPAISHGRRYPSIKDEVALTKGIMGSDGGEE